MFRGLLLPSFRAILGLPQTGPPAFMALCTPKLSNIGTFALSIHVSNWFHLMQNYEDFSHRVFSRLCRITFSQPSTPSPLRWFYFFISISFCTLVHIILFNYKFEHGSLLGLKVFFRFDKNVYLIIHQIVEKLN